MKNIKKWLLTVSAASVLVTSCGGAPKEETRTYTYDEMMSSTEAALMTYSDLETYEDYNNVTEAEPNFLPGALLWLGKTVGSGFVSSMGGWAFNSLLKKFFGDETQEKLDKIINKLDKVIESIEQVDKKLDKVVESLEKIATQISQVEKLVEAFREENKLIAIRSDLSILRQTNADLITFVQFCRTLPGLFETGEMSESEAKTKLASAYGAIHSAYPDIPRTFNTYANLLLSAGTQGSMNFFDTIEYLEQRSNFMFDVQGVEFYNFTVANYLVPFLQSAMVISGYLNYLTDPDNGAITSAEKAAAESWIKASKANIDIVVGRIKDRQPVQENHITFIDSLSKENIVLAPELKTQRFFPVKYLDELEKPSILSNHNALYKVLTSRINTDGYSPYVFKAPMYYCLASDETEMIVKAFQRVWDVSRTDVSFSSYLRNVGFRSFYKNQDIYEDSLLMDFSDVSPFEDAKKVRFSCIGPTMKDCKFGAKNVVLDYVEEGFDKVLKFENDAHFMMFTVTDKDANNHFNWSDTEYLYRTGKLHIVND